MVDNSLAQTLPDVSQPCSSLSVRDGLDVFQGFVGVDLEVFVGLEIAEDWALLDTGAQHAVVGPTAWDRIVRTLARHGLKPRKMPTLKMQAVGVGGTTDFLWTQEIPVTIGGISGTLACRGIESNILLLLPVDLCWNLGMILNMPERVVSWKYISRKSVLHQVGGGKHLAASVFEIPPEGWDNPYERYRDGTTNVIQGSEKASSFAPRASFE